MARKQYTTEKTRVPFDRGGSIPLNRHSSGVRRVLLYAEVMNSPRLLPLTALAPCLV